MRTALIIIALSLVTSLPASAQQKPPTTPLPPPPPPKKPVIAVEKHKRIKALYRGPFFMVKHPIHTFHRLTFPVQHPLRAGQWMESSGFNGLMAGLGSAGNIGTTAIVSAKKF